MNRDNIEERVLEALGEVVPEASVATLDRALLLRDQIEIDSVDFLNFVLALERRFAVEVPATSYPLFGTIAHAVECVADLLDRKS